MGHSSYSDYISHENAEALMEAEAGRRGRYYNGRMSDVGVEYYAVAFAVDQFNNERREGDASIGNPKVLQARSKSSVRGLGYLGSSSMQSFAVPLYADEDCIKTIKKVKVVLNAEEWEKVRYWDGKGGFEKVVDEKLDGDGIHVSNYKVLPSSSKNAINGKWNVKQKVVVVPNEGNAKKVYRIQSDKYDTNNTEAFRTRYDSQADARAAAAKAMKDTPLLGQVNITCHMERGERNPNLVSLKREVESATATIEVTILTPKPNAKVNEYLVEFDYHH